MPGAYLLAYHYGSLTIGVWLRFAAIAQARREHGRAKALPRQASRRDQREWCATDEAFSACRKAVIKEQEIAEEEHAAPGC